MRRVYEVSGGRDQSGTFHPPDENEMMRKLLAIREHLEDFGGAMLVVPKRVRVVDGTSGKTIRYETWGLIFRYDSSAPAAEMLEEPGDSEVTEVTEGGAAPEPEPEPEREPALTE